MPNYVCRPAALAACLSVGIISIRASASGPLDFRRLITSEAPEHGVIPSSQDSPSYSGGVAAFVGFSEIPYGGSICSMSLGGPITIIARQDGAAPSGAGMFTQVANSPHNSGTNTVFHAFTTVGTRGIYANIAGSLQIIANRNTTLPGGGHAQAFGFHPSIEGDQIAFSGGTSSTAYGIYSWHAGSISSVAVTDTPVPGHPSRVYGSFEDAPVLAGGRVAFMSVSGGITIYGANPDGTDVQTIVQNNDPVPGGNGNFVNLEKLDFDGQSYLFVGASTNGTQGIYRASHGIVTVVADTHTHIPGATGNFSDFGFLTELGISDGNVAFITTGGGGRLGIYGDFGDGLTKVIGVSDVLDGKTIADLKFGREGLEGNTLAFYARFTDQTESIYIVTVPAPAGAGVFVGAFILACRRRR